MNVCFSNRLTNLEWQINDLDAASKVHPTGKKIAEIYLFRNFILLSKAIRFFILDYYWKRNCLLSGLTGINWFLIRGLTQDEGFWSPKLIKTILSVIIKCPTVLFHLLISLGYPGGTIK
jgi:hypothetical protein